MGMIFKKKKPSFLKDSKRSSLTKTKLFRIARLANKMPSVIEEAPTDDDLPKYPKQNLEVPAPNTGQSMKVDNSEERIPSHEKIDDSGRSYKLSQSSLGSRQSLNRIRSNSIPNSIRSSGRNSSVQSLTVIREQYCCCSKWTTCERILGTTVGIMAIIIVILIIVIGVLSSNRSRSNFNGLTLTI